MCLIAFAWQVHPRWRLLLVANRDEFHARSSAPLARWADRPILGGRDLLGGGTWLGVTPGGRCAAVTNVRDPRDPQQGLSRGLLVSHALTAEVDAAAQARQLLTQAAAYRPFNLLSFDTDAGFYLGNRPAVRMQAIGAGVHGLSNADFNAPWPKTRQLIARLDAWLKAGAEEDFAPLFAALADETPAPDAQLPDTGVGLAAERRLSPAFVRGKRYGTRASTVVAIDRAGGGRMVERRFGSCGRPEGQTELGW